jgi:hypothetical protein
VLIIRRINYINTTSGICHSVSVTVSCFVIPDGCIVLVQHSFDVLVFIHLFCLFCIVKFYILLAVHRVMILGK